MSLKFNDAFDKVLEKLNSSGDESKEEEEICEEIDMAFHDVNSIFQGTLYDLKKTNPRKSYYQPWIMVKIPYKVEPNKLFEIEMGAVYMLKAVGHVRHPTLPNRNLDPKLFASMFDSDLKRAVIRLGEVTCQSGMIYTLDVTSEADEIVLYSIDATLLHGSGPPEFCYYFELGLKFLDDPNIYKPFGAMFLVQKKPINIIGKNDIVACEKLLKHLNVESSEDAKIAYFAEKFMNRPLSDAILDTLKYVVSVSENPERLSTIYEKLMHFKQEDKVELSELMALLDLN